MNFHRNSFMIAAGFLLIHAVLMFGFIRSNSPTSDEPVHIVGGLEILQNGGHTINPESGVFPQVWAALPNMNLIKMPPSGTMESMHPASYPFAQYILYNEYIDRSSEAAKCAINENELKYPSCNFFLSRMMMLPLSVLCGLLIFLIANAFCGTKPALLTLALYTFYPLFISNGPLATADMSVTLFLLASVYFFQRLLHRITGWSFFFTALALSLLFLSKFSSPIIAPVLLIMLLIKTFDRTSLRIRLFSKPEKLIANRNQKFFILCGICVLLTGVLFFAIWTAYGYRQQFQELPANIAVLRDLDDIHAAAPERISKLVRTLQMDKLLPHPYVYGFLYTYASIQERWSYLNGDVSMKGFRSFFPLVFLYKTPPPIILAFLIALTALACSLRKKFGRIKMSLFLPYLIFAAIFTLSALSSNLNIGYRHLMPAIAIFFPVTAFGFAFLFRLAWNSKKLRLLKFIPYILCVWCVAECMMNYPHSLSYFSSLFGGTAHAHEHVVDSSLDWGQDLQNIEPVLKELNIPLDGSENIFLAYFGGIPAKAVGVKTIQPLHFATYHYGGAMYEFKPGYYLVSATTLYGFYAFEKTDKLIGHREAFLARKKLFEDTYRSYFTREPFTDMYIPWDRREYLLDEYQSARFELIRRYLLTQKPLFTVNGSILGYYITPEQFEKIMGVLPSQ